MVDINVIKNIKRLVYKGYSINKIEKELGIKIRKYLYHDYKNVDIREIVDYIKSHVKAEKPGVKNIDIIEYFRPFIIDESVTQSEVSRLADKSRQAISAKIERSGMSFDEIKSIILS